VSSKYIPTGSCDVCSAPATLFVRVRSRFMCAKCWKKAGSPWPAQSQAATDVQEAEDETRALMLSRGGADRHKVVAGKT